MKNIIYHNPKCSKSRATLEILMSKGITIQVIEYLQTPPSVSELQTICKMLKVAPKNIVRTNEELYKDLKLDQKNNLTDQNWLELLAKNPKLIERPIVCYNNKAIIGRPPENVLEII